MATIEAHKEIAPKNVLGSSVDWVHCTTMHTADGVVQIQQRICSHQPTLSLGVAPLILHGGKTPLRVTRPQATTALVELLSDTMYIVDRAFLPPRLSPPFFFPNTCISNDQSNVVMGCLCCAPPPPPVFG